METIYLNETHIVRAMKDPVDGKWSGDVLMLNERMKSQATHLFDCPSADTREELQQWAEHALKAYREG